MKSPFVSELAPDQPLTAFFLVCNKEIRTGNTGKPYLRLELGDKTGTIEAKMWDNFEDLVGVIERDDFVKVQGRVQAFRGKNQVIVERIRPATPAEIEPEDYFPHTKENVDALFAELHSSAESVSNSHIRRLLLSVLDDPEIAPRFRRAPAAKSMHHAYLGGLLEHVVSLSRLSRAVAVHYPEADPDLLIAACILHDIGKIEELAYDRSLGYTEPGQLVGHIVQGVIILRRKADAIPGFPLELRTLLEHIILSHHGRYEFGSPKLPAFREALLFHYLDDLDSKMNAMGKALADPSGEGFWTPYNPALERRIFRAEQYLTGEPAEAPEVKAKTPLQMPLTAGEGKK